MVVETTLNEHYTYRDRKICLSRVYYFSDHYHVRKETIIVKKRFEKDFDLV